MRQQTKQIKFKMCLVASKTSCFAPYGRKRNLQIEKALNP